jgi:hypothetical protein
MDLKNNTTGDDLRCIVCPNPIPPGDNYYEVQVFKDIYSPVHTDHLKIFEDGQVIPPTTYGIVYNHTFVIPGVFCYRSRMNFVDGLNLGMVFIVQDTYPPMNEWCPFIARCSYVSPKREILLPHRGAFTQDYMMPSRYHYSWIGKQVTVICKVHEPGKWTIHFEVEAPSLSIVMKDVVVELT